MVAKSSCFRIIALEHNLRVDFKEKQFKNSFKAFIYSPDQASKWIPFDSVQKDSLHLFLKGNDARFDGILCNDGTDWSYWAQ
jgi:hypothetical protein